MEVQADGVAWRKNINLEGSCINVDICSLVVENFPRIYLSFITDDQVSSPINMLSIGKMVMVCDNENFYTHPFFPLN